MGNNGLKFGHDRTVILKMAYFKKSWTQNHSNQENFPRNWQSWKIQIKKKKKKKLIFLFVDMYKIPFRDHQFTISGYID